MLEKKMISYEVVEVDLIKGDEQVRALQEIDRLTASRAFPLLVINGIVIQGYKPEEIEEALTDEV